MTTIAAGEFSLFARQSAIGVILPATFAGGDDGSVWFVVGYLAAIEEVVITDIPSQGLDSKAGL